MVNKHLKSKAHARKLLSEDSMTMHAHRELVLEIAVTVARQAMTEGGIGN
jgi:hypothetical protein